MTAMLRIVKAAQYPSADYLFECLHYDPESGKLSWLTSRQGRKLNAEAGTIRRVSILHRREAKYRFVCVDRRTYPAHRLIWILVYGWIPVGMQIDHIDGDGLNNKLNNLRIVTAKEQARNSAMPTTNTSGHVGVYRSHDHRYWDAFVGGKKIGTFGSKREADDRAVSARLLL